MPTDRSILVADDDVLIRLLLLTLLRKEGFRVSLCSDGEQALNRLRRRSFALLITDYEMPLRKGAEVIRQLRAGGNPVPAILMSSHSFDIVEAATSGLSRCWFLQKPFGLQDLRMAIGIALGG